MAWKIKDICISMAATLAGHQLEIGVCPFRWDRPAFRWQRSFGIGPKNLHVFFGPFHIWTMSDLSAFIAFDLTFSQNHWHGGKLVSKDNV